MEKILHIYKCYPPLTFDYTYPIIVTMFDNNFDFIVNFEQIDASFKTLINMFDIIIKEKKKT